MGATHLRALVGEEWLKTGGRSVATVATTYTLLRLTGDRTRLAVAAVDVGDRLRKMLHQRVGQLPKVLQGQIGLGGEDGRRLRLEGLEEPVAYQILTNAYFPRLGIQLHQEQARASCDFCGGSELPKNLGLRFFKELQHRTP